MLIHRSPISLFIHHSLLLHSTIFISILLYLFFLFFFFNDTATTEIYTLSLHDALPICKDENGARRAREVRERIDRGPRGRSEEHTSELQSRFDLVCRLLLEKKKKK